MTLSLSRFAPLLLAGIMAGSPALAMQRHQGHGSAQPYAGLESRQIKSLSDDDLAEIRRGGGWGLALPAELNGRPGPAHLLELKEDLALTPQQIGRIEEIHAAMKTEAVEAGERFIEAEAALSSAFETDQLTPGDLRVLLQRSSKARAELRFVHLSRHLQTTDILSEEQIRRYQVLRGYAQDPCTAVPEGHDAEMWKRHNGCQ